MISRIERAGHEGQRSVGRGSRAAPDRAGCAPARRILEVGAAGLAAERATPDHLATLADEVAGLFASLTKRQVFLVHDINFHRGVAAASGNPIVASLVEMVSALYYERRRTTAERTVDRDLRDAADAHRQIYQAIRARDADRARKTMNDHLLRPRSYQAKEQQVSSLNARVSTLDAPGSTTAVQGPPRKAGHATRKARRAPLRARRSAVKSERPRRAAR